MSAGKSGVTACEKADSATSGPMPGSAAAARMMMSVAMEWPSRATGPVQPSASRAAATTSRVWVTRRIVVPSITVTSPVMGFGLRPWP